MERSHAQPSVPILQQALQYFMFIQYPTRQGSRAEHLKMRIKGDTEGKKSREGKFRWPRTISKLYLQKIQNQNKKGLTSCTLKILTAQTSYGKKCKLQSFWKVRLPDSRVLQPNQISFLSDLHEVKGNCSFPSLYSLKRKKYKPVSKKTGRYFKKWEATNLYLFWSIEPQLVLHNQMIPSAIRWWLWE